MEPVKSVLYVGNSYFSFNNGIGWHVRHLHSSTGAKAALRSTSITITGGGLSWHDVESYFRPDAIDSYSFNEDNAVVFNANDRLSDVVLMMDCSQCPVHPVLKTSFREHARKHSATVRRHGARPAFFMSWAYRNAPEMTGQLADAYDAAGKENDALVVPAGLAFAKALATRPTKGNFPSAEAVVRAGVRLIEEYEADLLRVQAKIDAADAAYRRGEYRKSSDAEAMKADIISRGEERSRRKT
jgi:Arc/MetJ-type ribon-helix-helix transcriptional regulator